LIIVWGILKMKKIDVVASPAWAQNGGRGGSIEGVET